MRPLYASDWRDRGFGGSGQVGGMVWGCGGGNVFGFWGDVDMERAEFGGCGEGCGLVSARAVRFLGRWMAVCFVPALVVIGGSGWGGLVAAGFGGVGGVCGHTFDDSSRVI